MAPLHHVIPRANFNLLSRQLRHRLVPTTTHRHASTTPPKPRVLEKPERFNPPSHGSRLPRRQPPRAYPGAPLTPEQHRRRYPNMMPAEGTWMHSFLTNRMLHVWITLSILITLVIAVQIGDFIHTTPYADLLPPRSMFLVHPWSFLGRYAEVYRMHVDYISAQTAERRRQKVEDVRKRGEFRRAHGLEGEEGVFGAWTAKGDAEVMGPGMREGGGGGVGGGREGMARGQGEEVREEAQAGQETYVDFEGKLRPVERKKWLGIW
ncbi:uncharacterized protein LTR77_006899 [Saxophila tyrrhenica]|uniref:Uncharacterized protein n=1 Tax=Saxophila tyrrhenica TaxID=1690608 RepID=A0AAV9P9J4_9PEZI|nr:hypothetical protein LTR77_006899 [Saxophila tyrrhenica]